MDMVEDLAEEDGDLALEEALPPGPMLAWDEEGCPDVAISSELREHLPRRLIPLMVALGLCLMEEQLIRELCRHMGMLEHLWEESRE